MPSKQNKRIPKNVKVLGIVSLLTDASSEMIYPLIPLFIVALGSGAVTLGIIEGMAETTAAMLKLAGGIISDKVRKRKILVLIGYAISSFIRPFTGIVSNAWQIVIIRMCDRVGKGIRTAPRDALIASSVHKGILGKAFGFHRAMEHLGAVIGPFLALIALCILILGFDFKDHLLMLRWTICLSVIPGFFTVLIILFFVKEKVDTVPGIDRFHFSLKQFDKNFIGYLCILLLFTLGNSSDAFLLLRSGEVMNRSGAFYSFFCDIPFLGTMINCFAETESKQMVMDLLFLPLIWAFFHVIKVIFSTPLGALSDKIGRKIVITIGWSVYAIVYIGFALIDKLSGSVQLVITLLLFTLYALFYAFTEGAEKAFVADMVKPEERGSAFGLYNFAVGLGALPASIIFGLLYNAFGGTIAFGTGAAIAFASTILMGLLVNRK